MRAGVHLEWLGDVAFAFHFGGEAAGENGWTGASCGHFVAFAFRAFHLSGKFGVEGGFGAFHFDFGVGRVLERTVFAAIWAEELDGDLFALSVHLGFVERVGIFGDLLGAGARSASVADVEKGTNGPGCEENYGCNDYADDGADRQRMGGRWCDDGGARRGGGIAACGGFDGREGRLSVGEGCLGDREIRTFVVDG